MKLQIIIVTIILTIFTYSTVQAEECVPGEGNNKTIVFLQDYALSLTGKICVFNKSQGILVGIDQSKEKTYFFKENILKIMPVKKNVKKVKEVRI